MEGLLDYSLCDRTITLYRAEKGALTRQVVEGCFLEYDTQCSLVREGKRILRKFLLVIPGDREILVGDRVYDGIGPEDPHWPMFLPAREEKLMEVGYVMPCCWNGQVCHVEAGCR